MIITKTPFRMSFLGGGSDLPAFYEKNGGSVLSTSINKYMYINLHSRFNKGIRVIYSKIEEVDKTEDIMHPIVRNTLKYFNLQSGIDISSLADIPARGTGLGSSSSYTVGLIRAIAAHKDLSLSRQEVAELACHIEIDLCGDPIGKQDQYAASFGGFNLYKFSSDGVVVKPLNLDPSFLSYLGAALVSVYTGTERSAAAILEEQSRAVSFGAKAKIQAEMVSLVDVGVKELMSEKLQKFGELLHDSWLLKKQLASNISNIHIDRIYELGLKAGAWGGKLLGAGAGGFICFLVDPKKRIDVKNALSAYKIIDLLPEHSGSVIIHNSQHKY